MADSAPPAEIPKPADSALASVCPAGLKFVRVLRHLPDSKSSFVLCEEPSTKSAAIVTLARREWTDADVQLTLEGETAVDEWHRNDKFSKYNAQPPPKANDIHLTLICPANDIDIAKYSDQRRRLVRETPSMYETVTRVWVDALPPKQTAWVRACLNKEQEADKILYEDEFAMLFPDTKWDGKDASSLYTLALLRDASIRSVRDLTGDHATPLKKLRDAVYTMLEAKFGCTADGLRVYMHYLPSFWMAHIHFAAITYPGGSSMSPVGKAILLDDVIDALERDPHHFQKASITYMVGERDPLHAKLVEAGALKPLLPLP